MSRFGKSLLVPKDHMGLALNWACFVGEEDVHMEDDAVLRTLAFGRAFRLPVSHTSKARMAVSKKMIRNV